MKKRKRTGWYEQLMAVAALGIVAVIYLWLVQVLVIATSVGIGIACALFMGWQSGIFAGIVAYFAIMKLLWYGDIWSMITSGSAGTEENKREDKEN